MFRQVTFAMALRLPSGRAEQAVGWMSLGGSVRPDWRYKCGSCRVWMLLREGVELEQTTA